MRLADASRSRSPPIDSFTTQAYLFCSPLGFSVLLSHRYGHSVSFILHVSSPLSFVAVFRRCLLSSLPPYAMLDRNLRGGGRTGTNPNQFFPVNAGFFDPVMRQSLHYRLIKLLIKLSLLPSIVSFLMPAQTGFQGIKINRVVPPLSVCTKQLNDTFSTDLISYT